MNYNIPLHLFSMPIYKKALDIITLSRSISTYLNYDLAHLTQDGKEQNDIYFSGDIIQQSICLAPEIINAQLERFSDKKHKHLESLDQLTYKLYNNCKRLERISNGRDYLRVLKKELKKFKQLQRRWVLTL